MKFTLAWLKSHLDTTASLDEIAAKLTAIGLEVEGITDPAAVFAPFARSSYVSVTRQTWPLSNVTRV